MKNKITFFLLSVLFSCSDPVIEQESQTTKEKNTYITRTVECSWPDSTVIDTTFLRNIKFSLRVECMAETNFTDTIEITSDSMEIRQMRDIRYVIHSSLFGKIIFTKASIGDSLASDLKTNGFLIPPSDLRFVPADSSVIIKSFIGQAESDSGDEYVYRIDARGKIHIIGVETPELMD